MYLHVSKSFFVFLKNLRHRLDSLATLLCGYNLFGFTVQVIEQNQQIVDLPDLLGLTCFPEGQRLQQELRC